jgi:hypothetical protein
MTDETDTANATVSPMDEHPETARTCGECTRSTSDLEGDQCHNCRRAAGGDDDEIVAAIATVLDQAAAEDVQWLAVDELSVRVVTALPDWQIETVDARFDSVIYDGVASYSYLVEPARTGEQRYISWHPMREAYRDRALLLGLLAAMPGITARLGVDHAADPGFRTVLYLDTPAGQVSFHIADQDRPVLQHVPESAHGDPLARWDGHTKAEARERIMAATRQLASSEREVA